MAPRVRLTMGMCHLAQDFTLEWTAPEHAELSLDAAEATLRGMAGRLTALVVPYAADEHLFGMQEAGPQLAGALSSLSFNFSVGEGLWRFQAATRAVLAASAGLQHVHLGLVPCQYPEAHSAAQIQAADAAFRHLMRSLPCCQSLRLDARGAVSQQAIGSELLLRGPDLVSLSVRISQVDEQVRADAQAQCSLHHP